MPSLNYLVQYDLSDITSLWQDAARTVQVSSIYDPIQGITDLSGRGNHGQQVTTASSPQYIPNAQNGLSVSRFDGVDDWIDLTGITSASQSYTIYFAVVPTSNDNAYRFLFDSYLGRLLIAHSYPSDPGQINYFDGAWQRVAPYTNVAQVLVGQFDGTTGAFFRDGSPIGTVNYAGRNIGGDTGLFANYDGSYQHTQGDLFEFGIVEGAVTSQDIADLQAALQSKWGTP